LITCGSGFRSKTKSTNTASTDCVRFQRRCDFSAWARGIRDQCIDAGIPFFFKQWGEWANGVVNIGKKAAGCLLDGVEWKQFPQVVAA
jgi:protein gp37